MSKESVGESNCINWQGCIDTTGYGKVTIDYKSYGAHRVIAYMFLEDWSPDLLVMHSCNNRACINPLHLFMGTYTDNNQDTVSQGRHQTWIGFKDSLDIEDMRGLRQLGWSNRKIAKLYGISYGTVAKYLAS